MTTVIWLLLVGIQHLGDAMLELRLLQAEEKRRILTCEQALDEVQDMKKELNKLLPSNK